MSSVPEMFGCMVFNDSVMKERLPKDTYKLLKKTISDGSSLDPSIANIVAAAMKDWAISKGATHYTHWFQPMTGITAEKHESFISPTVDGGVIMEFSGKELIKGEPDASSFPSGGLRATFEARGYTAWDPSSYAFIKDDTLCIPTAFCSYGGEALDMKTPLLRSMEALNIQALRVLKLLGTPAKRVVPSVGAEQEYFLIDKEDYLKREDLIFTGRTLFGARPPKAQELDDHYFGTIKERVKAYMRDLDEELWRLGILAKTEHNETAPAQHELAPVFTGATIATDHNQLTMEIMKKVAKRHDLVCLLHEKPFESVSGSGKHNNYSLVTDTGDNLFKAGKVPKDNTRFLFFLCAFIRAVHKHQDLIRISTASAGNDHRLGAAEAPPAIVSIFVGDDLMAILDSVEHGEKADVCNRDELEVGIRMLPHFKRDTTDRNRTSPLAFTGNKFELRMLGANSSIADTNTVLNTILAETLCDFADELESADNFDEALRALLQRTVCDHKSIVFNGNNYTEEWKKEAEKRGLLNLPATTDALKHFDSETNIALFSKFGIFSETEVHSRLNIMYENYRKVVKIEGYTMIDMVNKYILPAAMRYSRVLSDTITAKRSVDVLIDCNAELELLKKVSSLTSQLSIKRDELKVQLVKTTEFKDIAEKAAFYRSNVVSAMKELRIVADEIEPMLAAEYLPYPTYGKLLFSVM